MTDNTLTKWWHCDRLYKKWDCMSCDCTCLALQECTSAQRLLCPDTVAVMPQKVKSTSSRNEPCFSHSNLDGLDNCLRPAEVKQRLPCARCLPPIIAPSQQIKIIADLFHNRDRLDLDRAQLIQLKCPVSTVAALLPHQLILTGRLCNGQWAQSYFSSCFDARAATGCFLRLKCCQNLDGDTIAAACQIMLVRCSLDTLTHFSTNTWVASYPLVPSALVLLLRLWWHAASSGSRSLLNNRSFVSPCAFLFFSFLFSIKPKPLMDQSVHFKRPACFAPASIARSHQLGPNLQRTAFCKNYGAQTLPGQ